MTFEFLVEEARTLALLEKAIKDNVLEALITAIEESKSFSAKASELARGRAQLA